MLEDLFTQLVSGFGLLGLFIAAAIGNASVFLPLPVDIFVFALGALLPDLQSAFVVGIVTGAGAAVGEMSAYILGMVGISAAERAKHGELKLLGEVNERIQRWGFAFIVLASFTPFPFDLVGIAAGAVKYPAKKFFLAALVGKIPRYIVIAVAGFFGWAAVRGIFLLG